MARITAFISIFKIAMLLYTVVDRLQRFLTTVHYISKY